MAITKIKRYLVENNISQRDLHRKIKKVCITPLGTDRISSIVNGKTKNYSLFTLLKICVALDLSPNDLIDKEDFVKNEVKISTENK